MATDKHINEILNSGKPATITKKGAKAIKAGRAYLKAEAQAEGDLDKWDSCLELGGILKTVAER